jgi:hypothetical protein
MVLEVNIIETLFYYSTGKHTQRRFESDDLSLIVHYKFFNLIILIILF